MPATTESARRRPALEPLERRTLFAAGVVIDNILENDGVAEVVTAPDGKVVVVGNASMSGTTIDGNPYTRWSGVFIARYNADGSIDATFGDGGSVLTTMFAPSTFPNVGSAAVGPRGEIVIAGYVRTGEAGARYYRHGLVRFNPDGTLDTAFGTNGAAPVIDADDHPASQERIADIAVLPDGRIVAAGNTAAPSARHYYTDVPPGLVFDYGTPMFLRLAVFRYTAAGQPDPTFGGDGAVVTSFGEDSTQANALALGPGGKVLVAGSVARRGAYADTDFALARFNEDGTPDTTFGDGGLVRTDLGPNVYALAGAEDVLWASDGRITVGGNMRSELTPKLEPPFNTPELALARFGPDGRPDTTFGADGVVLAEVGAGDATWFTGFASLAEGPGGSVYFAGANETMERIPEPPPAPGGGAGYPYRRLSVPVLVRFGADGARDAAFDGDGLVEVDFNPGVAGGDFARSVAVSADGKVIVAGRSDTDAALTRFNPDGTVDASFGGYVDTAAAPEPEAYPPLPPAPPYPGPPAGPSHPTRWAVLRRGTLSVRGTRGNDVFDVEATTTGVRVSIPSVASESFEAAKVRRIVVRGGAGDDRITVGVNVTTPALLDGGAGNDTVTGGGGNDRVHGGAGNDNLAAGPGRDRVRGGAGHDSAPGVDATDLVRDVDVK